MNNTLIENIKIKSDLQYDFLFESKEYHDLDSDNKTFLKECYDMGVNQSIYLHQQDKALLESVDEGLWDRFKAGAARVGQGLKNVSGIGTPTTDSKDAGVDSLLNSFKTKWAKAPKAQAPVTPASNNQAIAPIVNSVNQNINQIAAAAATTNTPPPTPQQANVIVQQSNAPISLKTKIANLIRANPNKTKFLLGVLSFGAGVAAAAATAGNPIAAKVAAGLVNGLGNVAIAKIQGRGANDQMMAGLGGSLAGQALGTAGAEVLSLFSNATTNAVDATAGGFADTSDGNSPEVQVTQQQSAVSPEDLRTADTEAPDTGFADTSDANSPEYQATQQQSAVSPEDQSLPDTEAPDTNQYDAQGNRIDPQQQFADTSDANSPEVQATQQQVATTPQGATQSKIVEPGTRAARVASDAARQANYYKSRGYTGPTDTLGRPKSLFNENKEPMFVKSYNNTYTLKKSLNENIEEKWNEGYEQTIDEALSAEQAKIYDEFLTDFGKMFKKPKDQVIQFIQSQGTRFQSVLDFFNAEVNPSISGVQPAAPGGAQPGAVPPAAPGNISQITPQLKADIDTNIKTFLSGLTIINPKIQKLLKKITTTTVPGKNASYVFRLTNAGDIAFVIKGLFNQTQFMYQDKASAANANAKYVLIKEIKYKPIDTLKKNFIVELSKVLALHYSKLPQLAGQLKQDQLEIVINNYLTQVPGFDNLFDNIIILLDTVLDKMKNSKTKPKQIWIGVTNKGMGVFTGLKSKKKVAPTPGTPAAGKQPTGKVKNP
jgi:hypothetical protein